MIGTLPGLDRHRRPPLQCGPLGCLYRRFPRRSDRLVGRRAAVYRLAQGSAFPAWLNSADDHECRLNTDPEPAKAEAIKATENAHASINSTHPRTTFPRSGFVQHIVGGNGG